MSKPVRVLIVDDDEDIRNLLSTVLAEEGYDVLTAPHGAAALDIIARSHPNLILTDMRMPTMDGEAFAQAYHLQPGPHAPIVVISAADEETRRRAAGLANTVLTKPFDLGELLEVVDRYSHPA
ncbi:MAG: response regulator [Chloroflexi bacterium]|nr:response regulator [Chloroflexota bacterium]